MTDFNYVETIRDNCQLLLPRPTDLKPKLTKLGGIRAVLFDIYGTLLISASGDIGANSGDHRLTAIEQTVACFQLALHCSAADAVSRFQDKIVSEHASAKRLSIAYPEVDIVKIWQAVLPHIVDGDLNQVDHQRFALEYEVRVNPVWPMPGVEPLLARLAASELVLGIVSNAQFFTPLLFPAFLDKTVKALGFVPELSYFSYEHRQAKPSSYLFGLAQQQLQTRGIMPAEVLYVGNDMLNDIAAAAEVGFCTALFAGDQRSLRLRTDDERVQGVVPDVIIAELLQLMECLDI